MLDMMLLGLRILSNEGEVNPNELVETCTRAIVVINPEINAVVGDIEPPAASSKKDSSVFAGVPFILKDLGHGYAGVMCEMGSRMAKGFVFDQDTELARRFKSSGLIAVARSATPEFGMSGSTESILYGATKNPSNPELTTGGSSGRAAAAVAAGFVPMAHASEPAVRFAFLRHGLASSATSRPVD